MIPPSRLRWRLRPSFCWEVHDDYAVASAAMWSHLQRKASGGASGGGTLKSACRQLSFSCLPRRRDSLKDYTTATAVLQQPLRFQRRRVSPPALAREAALGTSRPSLLPPALLSIQTRQVVHCMPASPVGAVHNAAHRCSGNSTSH